jgi:WhiB family redox-sensing transcriptional regulator
VSALGTAYNLLPKGLNFGERPLRVDWMDDAACVGMDPERFFPNNYRGISATKAIAKQTCAICPVVRECLSFALRGSIQSGVFGGLDEQERALLHRTYAALFGESSTGSGEEFEELLRA